MSLNTDTVEAPSVVPQTFTSEQDISRSVAVASQAARPALEKVLGSFADSRVLLCNIIPVKDFTVSFSLIFF